MIKHSFVNQGEVSQNDVCVSDINYVENIQQLLIMDEYKLDWLKVNHIQKSVGT